MAAAENNPRERPILFNGEMVRAILAGQKTQTRRSVKPAPMTIVDGKTTGWTGEGDALLSMLTEQKRVCPLGQPGDRLWVRETWRPQTIHSCAMDTCDCDSVGVTYAADDHWRVHTWSDNPIPDDWYMPEAAVRGTLSSIHMPRWACRLLLEITAVRIERLQDISEADAIAEGATAKVDPSELRWQHYVPHVLGFIELWNSTGGYWGGNPWVWVIEFKRIEVES